MTNVSFEYFCKEKVCHVQKLTILSHSPCALQAGEPMGVKGKVASCVRIIILAQARIFSLSKYSRQRHAIYPSLSDLTNYVK